MLMYGEVTLFNITSTDSKRMDILLWHLSILYCSVKLSVIQKVMSKLSQLYKFGRLSSQYAIPREQGNTNLIFSNLKKTLFLVERSQL